MSLDIGKFLTEVRARATKDPLFGRLALMFEQIQDSVNHLGTAVGVDSTGHTSPPNAPAAINVKAANGLAHVVVTDNSQRGRALNYFLEASTDPSFAPLNTHVESIHVGRMKFLPLPAKTDTGDPQPWHFRAYSMEQGSDQRSAYQVFGGSATPTPVSVGGTTQLTPLQGVGSGTSTNSGEGFGRAQYSKSV